MNEVLNVIKNRRSIRKYLPAQIKEEDLKLIIESAIYAPSLTMTSLGISLSFKIKT